MDVKITSNTNTLSAFGSAGNEIHEQAGIIKQTQTRIYRLSTVANYLKLNSLPGSTSNEATVQFIKCEPFQ
jgi:hypothetical protein